MTKQDFIAAHECEISKVIALLPNGWGTKIRGNVFVISPLLPNLWEAANNLGACYNSEALESQVKNQCIQLITKIREFQGTLARESKQTTTVVFGTSGWREAIGDGFTILNVHKVVRGIIEMMKSEVFLKTNKYESFKDVKAAGILVLRDNRFMGDEFKASAMKELAAEGIRIYDAGECPTGVGSAILTELKAAGSINFTPSHNPMEYAGIKFNPNDGGPADVNLTSLIEENANRYMQRNTVFTPASYDYSSLRTVVDAASMFTHFVETKSKVFDLKEIRNWLENNSQDLSIVIDNMHGSSRGYIQNLLGPITMRSLEKANAIHFMNTVEDFSFHGVKPEPNAKNQAILMVELNKQSRKFNLAVALDPDADRIRFADAKVDLDMNRYGAVAFANLLSHSQMETNTNKNGVFNLGLATTVPSSGFASEIAIQNGRKVYDGPVGFKYFREPLSKGLAMMAYEESDGISFIGHTLEKCALAGFLSAVDAMAHSGKNLSELYLELRKKYGFFYPGKGGADVKGVSVEAWQTYKDKVMKILEGGLINVGQKLKVGDEEKAVIKTNVADGLKIVFSDRSWILLRPSGTEPKFRYYYEVVGESELSNSSALLQAYENAAAGILEKARALA